MDRKTYIKEVYSKYWFTAREEIYDFLEYDKNLCNYICEKILNGAKLLDVGIGLAILLQISSKKKLFSLWNRYFS